MWAPVWPHLVSFCFYWATSSRVMEPVNTCCFLLPGTWQGSESAAAAAFFGGLENGLQMSMQTVLR